MAKNLIILAVLAFIIALPFVFRHPPPQGDWREGDPTLVIVSPHNEAIRYEFGRAFSVWHKAKYGKPVKIDWRNIGGTTEISRYLASEYAASVRAWWISQLKRDWPKGLSADEIVATRPPARPEALEIFNAYRATDQSDAITSKIDLFFGGGEFDHGGAFRAGFSVNVLDELPKTLFSVDGVERIPEKQSGETWRTPSLFGNAVSTFGIIYNIDRLNDLKIEHVPSQWADMTDPRYFRQVGLADPTKSGSIAKAFEMIVHQQMHNAAIAAGYDNAAIAANEAAIAALRKSAGSAYQRGTVPKGLEAYQAALEKGFVDGLYLIQKIGANARYFTDSASKVPIDVSMGDAAVGMAIDFYGRYQAESSRGVDGKEHMKFVTPVGGTSVSCDPISLLRGAGGHAPNEQQAETRQVALRFIEFVLSDEGQRLWCYKVGAKDAAGNLIGPEKYALRRVPLAKTFYPSTQPAFAAAAVEHARHSTDDLADPTFNPYEISKSFVYYPRWTGDHFSVLRDIVRAMCLDSGEELRSAQGARIRRNAPDTATPFGPLPTITVTGKDGNPAEVPIDWRQSADMDKKYDKLEYTRLWTEYFREQYRKARRGEVACLVPLPVLREKEPNLHRES